jgi:DUF2075 family protein
MIIYSEKKSKFDQDIKSGNIAEKLLKSFYYHGIYNNNIAEKIAWQNSLPQLQKVLDDPMFSEDIQVCIEYQIPLTAMRIDFLIGGADETGHEHIIVIELKQWEEAGRTSRNGIVTAFTGGMVRAVTHPSYQAYSYAKTLENFNTVIQNENISVHSCSYLHNYKKSKAEEIINPLYQEVIDLSPVFIKSQEKKMREFIHTYISRPADRDIFQKIDQGKMLPSKVLQDSLSSMLQGNEEFIMIDEQKIVFETAKGLMKRAVKDGKKYTLIVEGGAGTGKSVVAIQLLVDLVTKHGLSVHYVTKNAAPRNVYFEKLKQDNYKQSYINFLFKSSGSYYKAKKNEFDCLLADEAHRLNAKSGLFSNLGENQIKEIINASKLSVFFIDEDQTVTAQDIGSISEIKKWADHYGSTVYHDESTRLTSQFRCNGSDGYIAFINDVLGIRNTANWNGFDMDYDLQIFDDPCEMREALREKNLINNKSRLLAGYCYEWRTQKSNDMEVFDIELSNGFRAKWNFSNTKTWAIDADSFDQVGCIHTSQGLEFDYAGVIIGKDLRYENEHVITDMTKRATSDKSLNGLKNGQDPIRADRIIRNTYNTLLTRGQKGCYIYCEDDNLRDYLRSRIQLCTKQT